MAIQRPAVLWQLSTLKCEVPLVTGKGAGLSEKGLLHKQEVIGEAIRKYDLYEKDAFTILETVGGLDIAGLVGVCIGGAIYRIPIVLDGVISLVAALTAEKSHRERKIFADVTSGQRTGG